MNGHFIGKFTRIKGYMDFTSHNIGMYWDITPMRRGDGKQNENYYLGFRIIREYTTDNGESSGNKVEIKWRVEAVKDDSSTLPPSP